MEPFTITLIATYGLSIIFSCYGIIIFSKKISPILHNYIKYYTEIATNLYNIMFFT